MICCTLNTEQYIIFTVPIEKKLQELIKKNKKSQKNLTDYTLLMAQDLWQAHDQILLIILLKEFTKLNVNTNVIIKNVKLAEFTYTRILEYTNFKDELIESKCLCCYKNYQKKKKKKDKNLKKEIFSTYKFSNQDINKFILFFAKRNKGICHMNCMDD